MGDGVELAETVIHHSWEQVTYGSGGDKTQLSLSAKPSGLVRGTVQRPTVFHHRLVMNGWELTGPPQLPEVWSHRARHALDQLYLRTVGEPHNSPDTNGRWDVAVRHRLRVTGAEESVPGQLTPHWDFTPTEMFVDVSTSGTGSVLLFGAGPVETDSKRYDFTVGVGGVVAFEQLRSDDCAPDWARDPVLGAVRLAFDLHAAANRQLTDESTEARA